MNENFGDYYNYGENNMDTNMNLTNGATPAEPVMQMPAVPQMSTGEPKKPKKRFFKGVAIALGCVMLCGAAGFGGAAAYDQWLRPERTAVAADADNSETQLLLGEREDKKIALTYVDKSKELTDAEIYAANVNSTVGITTQVTTNYFGYRTTSAASGSGFILSADGYIVTNYHVVEDATKVKVTLYDNTSYDATVVGYDEGNDLAVLKIDATGLTPVTIGSSDKLNVGDRVVAIGNPLGELTFSLTHGDVSALNRQITINNNAMTLIQTDCAINSGNSGGPLFNSYGEVVGIVNAKYSSSGSSSIASIDNIGFAIPIDSVMDILTSIIENGYVAKPYIGVTVYDLDSSYKSFGLEGAAISEVEEGGPADKAGLTENDIITKVNGTAISSVAELKSAIGKGKEGEKMTFTIYRKGETFDVEITLAVRKQTTESQNNQNGSKNGSKGSTEDDYSEFYEQWKKWMEEQAQGGQSGEFPWGDFNQGGQGGQGNQGGQGQNPGGRFGY